MTETTPAAKATKATKAKTLQDFRAQHDKSFLVPQRIREGLAALGDGGWEYEQDFVRLCGLSIADFARFRDDFSDYFVNVGSAKTPRRVWAGSRQLATKMREMV